MAFDFTSGATQDSFVVRSAAIAAASIKIPHVYCNQSGDYITILQLCIGRPTLPDVGLLL
jgi:hypothetical protein